MNEIKVNGKWFATTEMPTDVLVASHRLAVLVMLATSLVGCMGYVPGRQSYWDTKVKEMCEREGGIKVHEKISLPSSQLRLYTNSRGQLDLPFENKATPKQNYFYTLASESIVEDGSLSVTKNTTRVVRKSDGKVLSEKIVFTRVGGDVPTGISHPSAFACPTFEAGRNIFDVTFELAR